MGEGDIDLYENGDDDSGQDEGPESPDRGGDDNVEVKDINTSIKADDDVSMVDFTLQQLLKIIPRHSTTEQSSYKDELDFNELEYDRKVRKEARIAGLTEIFGEEYVSVMIAEYAENLYDGVWFSTNDVILYQDFNGVNLVGFFIGFVLIGKAFGDEILFHQYAHTKSDITIWMKLNKDNDTLNGHYFKGSNPQKNELTLLRKANSTLLKAAQTGDVNKMSTYAATLSKNSSVDLDKPFKDNFGNTVLHEACEFGQVAVVEYLMKKGADVSALNVFGETPTEIAQRNGFDEIVEWLS